MSIVFDLSSSGWVGTNDCWRTRRPGGNPLTKEFYLYTSRVHPQQNTYNNIKLFSFGSSFDRPCVLFLFLLSCFFSAVLVACFDDEEKPKSLYTSEFLSPSEHTQQHQKYSTINRNSGFELRPAQCSVFVSISLVVFSDVARVWNNEGSLNLYIFQKFVQYQNTSSNQHQRNCLPTI